VGGVEGKGVFLEKGEGVMLLAGDGDKHSRVCCVNWR